MLTPGDHEGEAIWRGSRKTGATRVALVSPISVAILVATTQGATAQALKLPET